MSKGLCKRFLEEWEEAAGYLVDVQGNSLIFEEFILELYPLDLEFIERVSQLKGERVSVLRTDYKDHPYHALRLAVK